MTGFDLESFTWSSPASPHKVAITSSCLGAVGAVGLFSALTGTGGYPQFGLYLFFYAVFHMLEFLVTAYYNSPKLEMNSFLLTNGKAYVVATSASVIEALLMHWLRPSSHTFGTMNIVGLAFVFVGQVVRTKAMAHAALSFSHKVASTKQDDHKLVTTGLYATVRHPSYTGFFVWSVGTQLLLGNVFCSVAFSVVLWLFFKTRIVREEEALVRFFGDEYVTYRTRVWSGLPFV